MDVEPRQIDRTVAAALEDGGISPRAAAYLTARGVGPDTLADYLNPRLSQVRPPRGIPNWDAAVDIVASAMRAKRRVGVYGDYDADGTTAAAVAVVAMRAAGCDVAVEVADRAAGYGFNVDAARRLGTRDLVLVYDCGTQDLDAVAAARAGGADVVVVDHHTVPESVAGHPAVLVNPYHPDCTETFRGWASAGLSWALAMSAGAAARVRVPFDAIGLAAVGTIADLMPLRGPNRVLAAVGTGRVRGSSLPGLAALAGVVDGDVDEVAVGWSIAPRLNAPGRLGSAEPAVRLLAAADPAAAAAALAEVDELNDERRRLQDRVAAAAERSARLVGGIVVARVHGGGGVAGVVAARLAEAHRATAVVISAGRERAAGSIRAHGGADAYAVLKAASKILTRFGGHRGAGGFSVDPSRLDELEAVWAALPVGGDPPPVFYDFELRAADVDERLVDEFAPFRPFGVGNEAPAAALRGYAVSPRTMGAEGQHLSFRLEDETGSVRVVHWRSGITLSDGDPVAVVGTPVVNEWRGRRSVEIRADAVVAP